MTVASTVKWAVAGLALAGAGWAVYELRNAAVQAQALDAAALVITEQRTAASTTQTLQTKVDRANAHLRQLEAERAAVHGRVVAADRRLRDATPDERELASATSEALRDYAASLDRDFAECREAVISLGAEAAAASDAAHALDTGWPAGLDIAAQAAALKGLK